MKTVLELVPGDVLKSGAKVISVDPNVVSTTSGVRIENGKDIILVNKNNMAEIVLELDKGIVVSYHWSKVMEVELAS